MYLFDVQREVVRYNKGVKYRPFFLRNKHIAVRLLFVLLLFIVSTLIFVRIAREVRMHETLPIDVTVLAWVRGFSTPWLDAASRIVTQLGGQLFVPTITILLAAVLWIKRYRDHALLIMAGVGGASVLTLALKAFFARARPELWPSLVIETSFSFPSGHAMASSALAASIVAVLWFTRWRSLAIVIGALYVLMIGFTRLYLGVHYPSDIVAGWLLGVAWVAAVSVIFLTSPLSLRRSI